jgi:hypothetical protein
MKVEYTSAFCAALKRVHWRVASDIDAAVIHFAESGTVARLASGPYVIRAAGLATGYDVAVRVHGERVTLLAIYFYRRR